MSLLGIREFCLQLIQPLVSGERLDSKPLELGKLAGNDFVVERRNRRSTALVVLPTTRGAWSKVTRRRLAVTPRSLRRS